eukprot:3320515-Pleurochrysis_carterae.AAC.1
MPIVATDCEGNLKTFTLLNVRCIPSLTDSLLSVSQLWTELGADCLFSEGHISLPIDANGQ